jgi:hypothetical protein
VSTVERHDTRSHPAAPATTSGSGSSAEEVVLGAVRSALRDVEYGSVLITIHQGEVVGIETSRKVRLKGT